MPQWRKLWVKSTESLDLNDMPDDFHRLLWLMLPLIACREGRGMDNPSWIKAKAMPVRQDVRPEQVEQAMCWFAERRMLTRYEVGGRFYFQIHNWHRYQGKTDKEAATDYPERPSCEGDATLDMPVQTNSGPTPDLLQTNSTSDADADADAEDTHVPEPSHYPEILERWLTLFPWRSKPELTNQTLRKQTATRWKDKHFQENWAAALERMTRASAWALYEKKWFTLGWFLKNDANWQKCLAGDYDAEGGDDKPPSEKATPATDYVDPDKFFGGGNGK